MPSENDSTDMYCLKKKLRTISIWSHILSAPSTVKSAFNIILWNTKHFSVVYNTSSGFSDASWSHGLYWLHDFEVKSAFLITQKRSVKPTTTKPQICLLTHHLYWRHVQTQYHSSVLELLHMYIHQHLHHLHKYNLLYM